MLEKLINLEIDETYLQIEDYLPYTPDTPLDCYLLSIIAEQFFAEKYYAGKLLLAMVNYLIDLLERGIIIRRIYTVATTEEGEHLAKSLGLTPIENHGEGLYGDFRHSYVLDLEQSESKSKLLKMYLQKKKNQERRAKRYTREISKK